MFKIPKMRGLYERIWQRVHRASHAQAAFQRPVAPSSSGAAAAGFQGFSGRNPVERPSGCHLYDWSEGAW